MRVYLDHNATTPVRDEVVELMTRVLREQYGNPSSIHAEGEAARRTVDKARNRVAALLGVDADAVLFTGGATEANNTALCGFLHARRESGGHIVTTAVEHPSIVAPLEALEAEGALEFGEVVLAPGQEVTVLVADDRETNRDILEKMLEAAGFRVRMADDGDTALEALREEKPDIVLMDVRMPRMNGIEAVKAIRGDAALKDLKVIAVTASVFPEFQKKALAEGFDDFLGKPFRTEELMEKLKQHLGVEFVSAGTSAGKASAEEGGGDFGEVPGEIVEKLRAALKIKNLTAINGVAKELRENAETAAFGEAVAKCARGFDFASLEELVKEAEERTTPPSRGSGGENMRSE